MGRLCAFAPGLPTRQSGTIASAWLPAIRSWRNFSCSWRKRDVAATRILPGRAPSGRPIERIVPHLLIDSRPGPKSGVAYQRRLQVPKLNGVQVTDGKQGPLTSGTDVSRDPLCQLAIELLDIAKRSPCACVPLVQIPEECVAADRRCLVPNADRLPAAATYPVLGWDGPRWAPAPRMLRDVVWVLTLRPSGSQLVSARKLCSGGALRPDLSWVLNYTGPSVPSKGPLAVHRTTGR